MIKPGTRVLDMSGKTVIPGIIEAHGHFPFSGISVLTVDLKSPPVGPVTTIKQALALLKDKAALTPAGKWVVGVGYDDTLLEDQ
ncbi:MAG: amidohydrolase family protein, partial [Deltaproteobacteria bacterium]|nr:amidohydrolase family protein [Deltaproteobacteria bacterium]